MLKSHESMVENHWELCRMINHMAYGKLEKVCTQKLKSVTFLLYVKFEVAFKSRSIVPGCRVPKCSTPLLIEELSFSCSTSKTEELRSCYL